MFIADECFNNIWRDEVLANDDEATPFELAGWSVVDSTLRAVGLDVYKVHGMTDDDAAAFFQLRGDLDSIWFGY